MSEIKLPPVPHEVDVSILVVTWNSERWIEECLSAIPASCGDASFEVLLHDNHSSDATVTAARRSAFSRLTIVESETNVGFAGGVNRLASRAAGRFLLLLNPDCVPSPKAIETLVRALDADDAKSAVVPLLVDEEGVPQRDFQFRRLPTLASLASDLLLVNEILPQNRVARRHHYRDLDTSVSAEIEQPAAAAFLIRKALFLDLGGLDERYQPAWFEDVDFCRRLADESARIFLVPESKILHAGGSSIDVLGREEFTLIWYRNLMKYARKWLAPRQAEVTRLLVIVGMLERIAATIVIGSRTMDRAGAVRAYARVLREAFNRWNPESRS